MEITWSIKEKTGDTWDLIQLAAIAGKTLEQFFTEAAGREIVAEFLIKGERCYFCGTVHWQERMKLKGKAVTFPQAVELLRQRKPGLLQQVIPLLSDVANIFPGAVIESQTQTALLPVEASSHEQAGLFA